MEERDKEEIEKDKTARKPKRASSGLVAYDPLQGYLDKVRNLPRLTPEEEHRLALQVKQHKNRDAALRLVTSHLYLVVSIAFQFHSQFQNMLDLIQEGNVGLMRAVQRFDPFRGVKLPTYAAYWIRAYILKHILDNWRLVRVGTTNTRRKLLFNLNKVTEQLRAAGIDPAPKRLAEHFKVSESDITDVQKSLSSKDVSLDATVADDSKRTYAEVIGEESKPVDEALGDRQVLELLRKHIDELAKTLKETEKTILFDRLMSDEPVTLAVIGEKYGVTREAIRQAEVRLVKKLQKHLEEKMPGISGFQFVAKRHKKSF